MGEIKDLLTVSFLYEFLSIFIPSLLGSYAKDYLNLINNREERMELKRTVISAFSGAFTILALLSFWDKGAVDVRLKLFLAFIFGMLGFQILERLSTIEGALNLMKEFWAFKNGRVDPPPPQPPAGIANPPQAQPGGPAPPSSQPPNTASPGTSDPNNLGNG
jgi:hypothetical protein